MNDELAAILFSLVVAFGLAIGVGRYLIGLGRAAEAKFRGRVEAQASARRLAELEKRHDVAKTELDIKREMRKVEEAKSKNRVVVRNIEFQTENSKAVFQELGNLLSRARKSFVVSHNQLRRFNRSWIDALDNRHQIEAEFLRLFVETLGGPPEVPDMSPSVYQQSASIDFLERYLPQGRAQTDETLVLFHELACFLQKSVELFRKRWTPADKLRLSDYNITIVLLVVQALKYQLVQFQVSVYLEHMRMDDLHRIRRGDWEKIESTLEKMLGSDLDARDEHEGSSVFVGQSRKIAEQLAGIVRTNAQSAVTEGEGIVSLVEETVSRFEDLMCLENMVHSCYRKMMDPMVRFQRLAEVGFQIEKEILQPLSSAFGIYIELDERP